ncbi:MAG TPA: hypothetical protein VMX16_15880 [Terriglobia bacterium]|nr:hypothetical protein [Terriglobia bacterium]
MRAGMVRQFAWLLFWAPLALAITLPGFGQDYVHRGAPQLQGGAWVETLTCDIPVQPGGQLTFRADQGPVSVSTGAQDRIGCKVSLRAHSRDAARARSLLDQFKLTARRTGESGVYLSGRFNSSRHHSHSLNAQYQLQVPERFNLDLATRGGSLHIDSLGGELRGVTAGGEIRTGDITGPVHLETAGGSIRLGSIGARLDARTAGGGISVGNVKGDATLETSGGEIMVGIVDGALQARTAGGDITLQAAAGPVIVETAGGQIRLGQCGGAVQAQTAGGNIHLDGARGTVRAETAGGSIDLLQLMSAVRAQTSAGRILAQINANRSSFGASSLSTSVGDVDVFLPPDLPLTINAVVREAAGHKIFSDFPLQIEGNHAAFNMGPIRGKGKIGGGGDPLDIKTSMGNIHIGKLNAQAIAQMKAAQENFWKQIANGWPDGRSQLQQMKQMEQQMRRQELQLRQQLREMQRQIEQP